MQNQKLQTQKVPPPTLEQLRKLQLFRTTLVNFLDYKDFENAIKGCFVRVLLQMQNRVGSDPNDSYYITPIKGAKKGPSYGGFSCDGTMTDWHILIDLPPAFQATSNGNVLQLPSISNTAFKVSEYEAWIAMSREYSIPIITNAQLEMRCNMLEQDRKNESLLVQMGKKGKQIDEATIKRLRLEVEPIVMSEHHVLPIADSLEKLSVERLQEIEQQCLDFMSTIRVAINERSKCCKCKQHVATVVFCPCKHQVVCKECMEGVTICPAVDCGEYVQTKFDIFTT